MWAPLKYGLVIIGCFIAFSALTILTFVSAIVGIFSSAGSSTANFTVPSQGELKRAIQTMILSQ